MSDFGCLVTDDPSLLQLCGINREGKQAVDDRFL